MGMSIARSFTPSIVLTGIATIIVVALVTNISPEATYAAGSCSAITISSNATNVNLFTLAGSPAAAGTLHLHDQQRRDRRLELDRTTCADDGHVSGGLDSDARQ